MKVELPEYEALQLVLRRLQDMWDPDVKSLTACIDILDNIRKLKYEEDTKNSFEEGKVEGRHEALYKKDSK